MNEDGDQENGGMETFIVFMIFLICMLLIAILACCVIIINRITL